jgi:hypothetical protein
MMLFYYNVISHKNIVDITDGEGVIYGVNREIPKNVIKLGIRSLQGIDK